MPPSQGSCRLQQTDHHPHRVPQQAAVARLVHQRRGDRAVQPHDAAVFQLLLPGVGQQRPIDRLPGLGPDRADRLLQHRLLRAPRPRQPGEGPKRRGILQMKCQLLVAQLAVLLEKRTAQHRLRRQASPSGLLDPVAAQVRRHQAEQRAMRIQPVRHRLQLAADLVPGENIEYAGLDGAFLTHCRLRRWRVLLWNQWLDPKVYLKPPGLARRKIADSSNNFNSLAFVDGH